MMVIADASAVGAFLLADEAGPFADFARSVCRTNPVHVPSIWPAEIASLIRTACRRGRLADAERDETLLAAEAMRSAVHIALDPPIAIVVDLALRTGLSAYDATYALLAQRLDAPLLTGDGPLRRAAELLGLKVLTP